MAAYAFTQEVPISWEVYQQLKAEIGEDPPAGLIVHVVQKTDQGLRYLDVWESREDFARFARQRLHPALQRVFARLGMARPSQEPVSHVVDVREVWAPARG
jgi:hypothetical protein